MNTTLLAFGFNAPGRLWLLVGVAALAVSYVVLQMRRRSYAVRFTNLSLLDSVAPKRPGWRRHVPAALMLLGLAGLVGALAQPVENTRVPRERATIIIAIDTSLSMQATDVAPNRIEAAQAAATSFIEALPDKINVGLVTFNGVAKISVPPTQNHDQLIAAIEQIRLGERTAIGEAIFASLDAIESVNPDSTTVTDGTTTGDGTTDGSTTDSGDAGADDPVPARIVVMSDGSTTYGRPDAEAAAAAERAGVPVSTIAFGTPEGTIQIEGEAAPVSVAVDGEALRSIAETTGGTFFEAATGEQLRRVYDDIGSSVGWTTEERDISERFVAASLLALALAAAASQLWFSRLP
ncbi:MAG: VWA domain-containing protein [Actinobacteria bacterium]|nr:VWA domain-containing protein [Actinomycetota bacterium]